MKADLLMEVAWEAGAGLVEDSALWPLLKESKVSQSLVWRESREDQLR